MNTSVKIIGIMVSIIITFNACQNDKKQKTNDTVSVDKNKVDTLANSPETIAQNNMQDANQITKDTLQYLTDGENEDNLYSMFLTRKLDTINIVLEENQYIDTPSKNKMYYAEWKNELITSGGDSEIKYQQAFMKKLKKIDVKPFK